jgi:hypothetical protein
VAELKLRLNLDAEEVELVVDGQVALSSGQDVFVSWVEAFNEKHKPVEPEAPVAPATAPVEEKVVDVTTSETVEVAAE